MSTDYSALKREILFTLRGERSQVSVSRSLGYSYNRVHKWESETTRMKWRDFYDFCAALNVSVEKAFCDVFVVVNMDISNAAEVFKILLRFHSTLSIEELAKKLHCHSSVLRRWIAGTVQPDVEIIFKLMDLRSQFLAQFVSKIVPIERIDTLADRFRTDTREILDDSSVPQFLLVQLCLGLKEYQELPTHSDELIARIAHMPLEDVRAAIHWLLHHRKIQWSGGKLSPDLNFLNCHGDRATISRLQRFWTRHSLKRLSATEGGAANPKKRPNLQCATVFTVSKEGMKRIAEKFHTCFEEAIQLVNTEAAPPEEIRVLILDMFSPDDLPDRICALPHTGATEFEDLQSSAPLR